MAQAQGTIVQCIGAVTDIEFPRDAMPRVYDALILEIAAQAGIRAFSMDSGSSPE